jgi:2-amino-4-hydroxy-6-hydroxymethyldihydropteridine diphosphokinase
VLRYSRSVQIVIGLGGNLGSVERAFARALAALVRSPGVVVRRRSSVYRTAPVGPEQGAYRNAALLVEVAIPARALLQLCLGIESAEGRDRGRELRWGPRALDLDLLIAEGLVCRGGGLELPHPRLAGRAFALVPAAEVAPGWVHPLCGRRLDDLAAAALGASPEAVERLGGWV